MASVETGRLELRIAREWPEGRISFYSFAWEGDTVFEQFRDLNYPPLERQLDEVGATVVFVQFGQMESLGGEEKLGPFITSYEALLARVSGEGKRRIILLEPTPSPPETGAGRFRALPAYAEAVRAMARRQEVTLLAPAAGLRLQPDSFRNGVHLTEAAHARVTDELARLLGVRTPLSEVLTPEERRLEELIRVKNRLWFDYVRPSNRAFFIGERTEQPFGRDHRDMDTMLFPIEAKLWPSFISAQQDRIWAQAREMAGR